MSNNVQKILDAYNVTLSVKVYCTCGDALHYRGSYDGMVESLLDFISRHSDEGHGSCDARTCLRARKKREGKK
jgi:hypothetical protein